MNEGIRNESLSISASEQEHNESLRSIVSGELDLFASYFDPLEDIRLTQELVYIIGARQFIHFFSDKLLSLDFLSSGHVELLADIAEGGASAWVIERIGSKTLNLHLQAHRTIVKGIARSGTEGASWALDYLGEQRLHIQKDWDIISILIETGARDRLYSHLDCELVDLNNADVLDALSVFASFNAKWVREHFGDKLNIGNSDHEGIIGSAIEGGGLEWAKEILQVHIPLSPNLWCIACKIAEAGHGEWLTQVIDPSSIDIPQPTHLLLLDGIAHNGGAAWVQKHFKEELKYSALAEESAWRAAFDNGASFPNTDHAKLISTEEKEKKIIKKARKNFIAQFTKNLERLRVFCKLEDDVVDELKNRILSCLERLPTLAIPLLELSLKENTFSPPSFFSRSALGFFDAVEQGVASRALHVVKGGSELTILIKPQKKSAGTSFSITFINDIAQQGAGVWQQASQLGIPVAPLLSEPASRPHDMARVYSRYCGVTIGELKQLEHPALNAFLFKQRYDIVTALEREGINHGHMHDRNFTVEFIEKEWLDTQLAKRKNVNSLPAQSQAISFEVADFLKNPERFISVVRLIDWDAARKL